MLTDEMMKLNSQTNGMGKKGKKSTWFVTALSMGTVRRKRGRGKGDEDNRFAEVRKPLR